METALRDELMTLIKNAGQKRAKEITGMFSGVHGDLAKSAFEVGYSNAVYDFLDVISTTDLLKRLRSINE